MEQGEFRQSSFFHGHMLMPIFSRSARGIMAENHSMVFSPVSLSHSGTFSRSDTSRKGRKASMSGAQA